MTTLVLFDYDGVLNPIPYEKRWVGPKDSAISSFASIDPKNWETVELPIDDEVYFKPDQTATVTLPGYYKDREIQVRWSTELISKINALDAGGQVEIRWLTAWRQHAPVLLAPLLGLDPSWESMDWQHRMSDYGQWSKLEAIENMLEKGERRPLVWVDDVAIKNTQYYEEENIAGRGKSPFREHGIETLFVETSTNFAISRAQWDSIEKFVKDHAES